MYVAKLNLQNDLTKIKKYIEQNGFATLYTSYQGMTKATHTPLMLHSYEDQLSLSGHIARANSQCDEILAGAEVLAVFMEHHTYVSSSWYDHVNVPTWNYIAVHITGTLVPLSPEETLQSLTALTDKYEGANNKRFEITQMTEKSLKSHLNGLLAFRIDVKNIEASWKLSQNRDDKNYKVIMQKLRERGDDMSKAIADEMEAVRSL